MKNDAYWIALQNVMGYGNPRAMEILRHFDSLADFFAADEKTVRNMHILTPAELKRRKSIDRGEIKKVIAICRKNGYQILTPEDEEFPRRFLRIKDPPAVLYVQGELPDMEDELGVAMVGTRNCTKSGLIVGSVLSYRLAEAGCVIISGGALGIDTACLQGAVAVHKKSVIVLGCGLDYPYLLSNRKIRDSVAQNGAVITEYQPGVAPSVYTFPVRNRLMSALANGVVLIEAPLKSGALITVSHALEQGKDIFVIPGDITNKNYAGNNRLLQDGARAVYTPRDVVDEYISQYPHKLFLKNCDTPLAEDRLFINLYNKNKAVPDDKYVNRRRRYTSDSNDNSDQKRKASPVGDARRVKQGTAENAGQNAEFSAPAVGKSAALGFEDDEIVMKIYNCFTNKPLSVDILIEKSGLPASDVLYALTELEMNGAVTALAGGLFELNG